MKLSICFTVALTALSVAAAPSFGSPMHLEERGKASAAAGLFKVGAKIAPHVRLPHGRPAGRPAPHKPSRPGRRPNVRLPTLPRPGPVAKPRPQAPAPPPSNTDGFAGMDGMFNDAASQNEPHFSVGSLLRRNRGYEWQ